MSDEYLHPFGDILSSAKKLPTSVAKSGAGVDSLGASSVPTSLIDSDLTQIFEQSKELWQRKRVSPFDETFPLTKLRPRTTPERLNFPNLSHTSTHDANASWSGSANYSNFNELLKRADQLPASGTGGTSSYTLDSARPYSQLALNEIERCVDASIRRGREETESRQTRGGKWTLSAEERELSMLGGAARRRTLEIEDHGPGYSAFQPPIKRPNLAVKTSAGGSGQQMDFQAVLFAKKIDAHLQLNCEAAIRAAIIEAVEEMDDREVAALWEKVFSVCSQPLLIADEESVAEMRLSRRWSQNVIDGATDYLQRQFKDYAAAVVKNHLVEARRGGRTDAISLVEAFLNVKMMGAPWKQRTQSEKATPPKWALIFYSMRVGDFASARQLLLDDGTSGNDRTEDGPLLGVLEALSAGRIVEMESRLRLLEEWRGGAPTCQDAHQRAVHGALLGFDTPEVNSSIEDWLWARLTACKTHPNGTEASFRRLQTAICVDCGEDYFVHRPGGGSGATASSGGGTGSYLLYFTALMLTGQLERAIHALWRGGYRTHAVHAAIHCYQLKLLQPADSIDDEILTAADANTVSSKLNFPRLVLRYVESALEPHNLADAINYSFFLHKFELADTDDASGEEYVHNLFQAQLSRLLLRYGHIDDVLGRLDARGERLAGLVDKFCPAVDIPDTIGHVAKDINAAGDVFKACQLYVLAERPNEALRLINRKLAATAHLHSSSPNLVEDRRRSLEMAAWLSQLYRSRGEVAHLVATLNHLTSLHQFFQHYQRGECETALKILERVRLIPVDADEIQTCVSTFAMVPAEVRQLLPDVCVALMRCIVALYDSSTSVCATPDSGSTRGANEVQTRMRAYAKAVVLYCASVPYQLPVSTSSILLQLQAQIA